eukprot:Nitzschia sp. Nitz4//scaffold36_size144017//43746//45508//NITZ4_003078-RA/size144017-snap-gene-0.191-mRNA-1//1//CDS//3329549432//9159//frame0
MGREAARKRNRPPQLLCLLFPSTMRIISQSFWLIVCFVQISSVFSKVVVPDWGLEYESMPADFGVAIPGNVTVQASLQTFSDWPQLCNSSISAFDINKVKVPDDGMPVALLVERGGCTFWEKAQMASLFYPIVQYVIVYDFVSISRYQTMNAGGADADADMELSLFFVTQEDGLDLRDLVLDSMDDTSYSGLLINLDSKEPEVRGTEGLDLVAYLVAVASGVVLFVMFFLCLWLADHFGFVRLPRDAQGRITFFNAAPQVLVLPPSNATPRQQTLLTKEQVDNLAEEIAPKSTDEESSLKSGTLSQASEDGLVCAICLDHFDCGTTIKVLPCNHKYHYDCLLPWLTERHASCPLCKFDLLHYLEACKGKELDDTCEHSRFSARAGDEESPSDNNPSRNSTHSTSLWTSVGQIFGGRWLSPQPVSSDDGDSSRGGLDESVDEGSTSDDLEDASNSPSADEGIRLQGTAEVSTDEDSDVECGNAVAMHNHCNEAEETSPVQVQVPLPQQPTNPSVAMDCVPTTDRPTSNTEDEPADCSPIPTTTSLETPEVSASDDQTS